jgi:hypothetical protein
MMKKLGIFAELLMLGSGFAYTADQGTFSVQKMVDRESTDLVINNTLDIAIKVKMVNRVTLRGLFTLSDEQSNERVHCNLVHQTNWFTIKPSEKISFKALLYVEGLSDIDQSVTNSLLVRTANKNLRAQKEDLLFKDVSVLTRSLPLDPLTLTIGWFQQTRFVQISSNCNADETIMKAKKW